MKVSIELFRIKINLRISFIRKSKLLKNKFNHHKFFNN